MSPKSKRKNWKKKHGRQVNIANQNILKENVESKEDVDTEILKPCNPKATVKNACGRRKIRVLEIIRKTAKQMQLDGVNKSLLALLDNLLTVPNYDAEKRDIMLQIIIRLCNQLNNYDVDELQALEKKIISKFMPRELRKLTVDEGTMDISFFSTMESCHFGELRKGYLKAPDGSRTKVVIKVSEEACYDQLIIEEAKIMSQLDHENVLKILAFEKEGPRFAVEYMTLGNLSDALEVYTFSEEKLMDILREVTSGMEYIATKGYVHRDLRCENILLDSNATCKIGEFGLCRYVGDTDGVYEDETIDGDHLAPESRQMHKFTTKSDVWMLGLLCWELYYPSTHSHVYLKRAYLMMFKVTGMLMTPGCSLLLWKYFKRFLLNRDPEKRPTFTEVKQWLCDYNLNKE